MLRMLSIREFRNTPGVLWRSLKRDKAVALSANGVPKAVVFEVDDDLEETVRLVTEIRAKRALARLRSEAAALGLDTLSTEEIEAEVTAARRARRRRPA